MASDYLSSLIGQLDPNQKKQVTPDNNSGIAGGRDLSGTSQDFQQALKQPSQIPAGGDPNITGLEYLNAPTKPLAQVDNMAASGAGWQGAGAPAPAASPAAAPAGNGFKLADKGFLVGFDTDKLNSADSGSAAGSKYTPAAKLFGKIAQSVGVQRGNLGDAVAQIQANGFPNAKAVGDDKIDFGDGNGPVDVVRSDGQVVFQNTTSNPVWEGKYGGGSGGGGSDLSHGASGGASPVLAGNPSASIQSALGQYGQPSDLIQQLIAKLQGAA